MTKRITSEDCEGNIEDIEDGRYNTHVVPVSAEDDPGYEEIDYGDCTEFTVPLGRYGSHVVPIGGGGGVSGAACPNGGLKAGTNIDGKDCLSVNLKPDGAIILEGGQLAIDTSKLKVSTDQVYPSGTDTGIVLDGPNGETWDTQADYNNWLYEDQERQDERIEEVDQASKARDLLLEAEILVLANQLNGKQRETFINSADPGENPYPGYKVKDDKTFTFNQNPWDPLPRVGDELRLDSEDMYASQKIVAVSSLYQDSGPYTLIDVTVQWGVFGLENAQVGDEAKFELVSGSREYVTHEELAEDQKRQDDEIEAIKDSLNFCKVDQRFVCFPVGIMHSDMDVHFTGNGAYFTTAHLFEVGDELTITTNDGEVDTYTINNVGDIEQEPVNGNEKPFPKRLYTFTTACAHNYVMKGSVHITSCNYPWDEAVDTDNLVLKSGDTMTGDLIVEADVHANHVETLSVDSGERSNLNLKYNGATKVYVGGSEVTIQPPLQLNTEGVDPNHAVTKGYIDALDAKQAAEISTIEYKLDALLGLTFQGTYEFKHNQTCEEEYQECMANCIGGDARCEQDCLRDYSVCEGNNVDPGYFEAIDPDGRFDHLQEIVISKNDKSGIEVDWAGVLDAGDYLEVDHVFAGSLDKTNYGLYRITEEPVERTNSKGEKVYDLTLQFLQGDGVLNESELYEIRGITAAEGVNPEELGDFLTKDDAAALYATKSHTHSQYASSSHTHSGSDITSGTISINRLPTGTTSSTVSKGNHTHSYLSKGTTNKYMTHKGEAGVCEFYISGGNLYWRT